jgi:hypothetical protein
MFNTMIRGAVPCGANAERLFYDGLTTITQVATTSGTVAMMPHTIQRLASR